MHLRMPADEADWKLITENFRLLWDLGIAMEEGHLHIPMMNLSPTPLHWEICLMSTLPSRCFLWKNLRWPYHSHGRVFDHAKAVSKFRLTWARQLSENRFGILVERWQIYKRTIELTAYNVTKAVFTTCVLHNFLQLSTPLHISVLPPDTQSIPLQLMRRVGRRAAAEVVAVHVKFMTYFTQHAALA